MRLHALHHSKCHASMYRRLRGWLPSSCQETVSGDPRRVGTTVTVLVAWLSSQVRQVEPPRFMERHESRVGFGDTLAQGGAGDGPQAGLKAGVVEVGGDGQDA